MSQIEWARRVARDFEFGKDDARRAASRFVEQLEEGLQNDGATMSQIPSYVTNLPDGTDTGLYLAVDLGGTNLRVCAVDLHGDTTYTIKQSKVAIPPQLMVAETLSELFGFIATRLQLFLEEHHAEYLEAQTEGSKRDGNLLLGLTFSFAFEQQALNKGSLLRWTKGFNIPDAIGKDLCSVLQAEINARGLPITVAALVNDTTGTLLARSYTSLGNSKTVLGAIFGTGTNGAYVERLKNVTKLKMADGSSGDMCVNTEWGGFDDEMQVLPDTPYDRSVDAESVHPGTQLFEKRISGMYLGEILRHAIVGLVSRNRACLTSSPLYQQFAIDASFLSMAAADDSPDLVVLKKQLIDRLDLDVDLDTTAAVKILALAIGKRAARLAGVAVAGVLLKTNCLSDSTPINPTGGRAKTDKSIDHDETELTPRKSSYWSFLRRSFSKLSYWLSRWRTLLFGSVVAKAQQIDRAMIDVGVDGSLIEFYPGFEHIIRSTLRDIQGIGVEGERRIQIGIAKDGSGVGAALAARMAEKAGLIER